MLKPVRIPWRCLIIGLEKQPQHLLIGWILQAGLRGGGCGPSSGGVLESDDSVVCRGSVVCSGFVDCGISVGCDNSVGCNGSDVCNGSVECGSSSGCGGLLDCAKSMFF
jgi:hypothetical protein